MGTTNPGRDPRKETPTAESTGERLSPQELTIVGIGASAGGLTPLRTFFASIPADTGMTFVVVIHLSPDYESSLAELLQGYTAMPVTQVQVKVALAPNHVYVIPPGKHLRMRDGYLILVDPEKSLGQRLQIDTFFRSLAEEHGDGAAIILSGSGSDGAVGMRSIKEQGGLLLVQSPDEAEYDGMPKSAIATGLVDIVAPVAELATQLVAAKRIKMDWQLPEDPNVLSQAEHQTLVQILTQLRLRTGQDFSGYREATILRRIARRMQLVQLGSLSAYLNRLRQDEEEVDALYRDVLIHVTEFFRDPEAWATLAQEIVPKLFAGKTGGEGVRVWTVGCATGEEAYGLAMVLLEYASTLDNPPPIQVFASDLGKVALDFARNGTYPDAIEADVTPERLARFFTHENDHYQVRAEVRALVLFTSHNLLQDPPFSKIDLIVCRNVLIYLQRTVQAHVFESFHYALRPTGYLFLGSAESAEAVSELFETVEKRHRLYRRSRLHGHKVILPALPLILPPLHAVAPVESAQQHLPSKSEQHRLYLEELGLPSLLVNEQQQVLHYSETVGRYLQHPAGPPTDDLLHLVRPELQAEVRRALNRAFSQHTPARTRPVPVRFNGAPHPVTVLVRPGPQRGRALVLFWEDDEHESEHASREISDGQNGQDGQGAQFEAQLLYSEQQLQSSKEEYESSVEELRAANEELQSTNEEYRSTLEELETSKEELQSTNEELHSVNQEMKIRMEEITTANSDLQNLFAATEIATLFLDRDLCVKRYTPHAAELFNLMPTDRGRPIAHLRSKLTYPTLEADVRRVLSNLIPLEREIEAADERWFLVGVRPYRTMTDRIEGVVITCVDITANKENEIALREANQQLIQARDLFSTLFHANPIPTALTQLQDNLILDANDAYLRFFDMPREAVVGKSALQLEQWLEPGKQALFAERLLNDGHIENIEITTVHSSGRPKTAIVSVQRVEQEGIEAAISVFVDITDLKQAQETLRRSEVQLRLTLDSVTDYAFITLDTNGYIVDWRGGAEQIFGYNRDEILGQPFAILFTPEDQAHAIPETEIEQARTTGRALDERWHIRKDGTRFFMSGVMVLLQHEDSSGYVKVGHDLTRQREMQEALETEVQVRTEQVRTLVTELTMSEQEERRRISAVLHDELQQRLFSMNVQLVMLRSKLERDAVAEGKQIVEEIGAALSESVQMTRNLSVSLSPPVLHNEGLLEAVRWLATLMEQQQRLQVKVEAGATLPLIDEDLRVLLFQVVRELLFNVVKHAGVTTATVSMAFENDQLRIEVSDEGQGFDTNSVSDGSSQGLQRLRQRLNLIGGRVQVISSPGQGTRIIVNVPQLDKYIRNNIDKTSDKSIDKNSD